MSILMAMYSEYFYSKNRKLLKCLRLPSTYLKYLIGTQRLSQRLVDIFENADIDFDKSFLLFCESKVFNFHPNLGKFKISVNKTLLISPTPLQIYSDKHEELVDIPIPNCHFGKKSIFCRLLSSRRRKGMVS